nr:hypothetical protein BHM03_00038743 [Ipomoea batatas]
MYRLPWLIMVGCLLPPMAYIFQRTVDGNAIAVAHGAEPKVVLRVSDQAAVASYNVVDVNAVDDHVLHKLEGDPGAAADVDPRSSTVDRLVALHDQLLVKPDDHVTFEDDPQRLLLYRGVTEGPRLGIRWIVRAVRHHVDLPILAADGFPPEPEPARRQPFPVSFPI